MEGRYGRPMERWDSNVKAWSGSKLEERTGKARSRKGGGAV